MINVYTCATYYTGHSCLIVLCSQGKKDDHRKSDERKRSDKDVRERRKTDKGNVQFKHILVQYAILLHHIMYCDVIAFMQIKIIYFSLYYNNILKITERCWLFGGQITYPILMCLHISRLYVYVLINFIKLKSVQHLTKNTSSMFVVLIFYAPNCLRYSTFFTNCVVMLADEDRDRKGSKHRRDTDGERVRDKDRDRDKDKTRDRDKDKDRDRDKDREKRRDKDNDRDRDREKARDRDKDRDREKGRDRDKEKARDKDKDRDRHDKEKGGKERERSERHRSKQDPEVCPNQYTS